MRLTISKAIQGFVTLLAALVVVFIILRLVPSDPATILLGDTATPEQIAQARALWGLDKPVWEQFFIYVGNLLQGNAGISFQYSAAGSVTGAPVWDLVVSRLPYTAMLAAASLAISVAVAVPLGILTANKADSAFDHSVLTGSLLLSSLPNFWIGLVLITLFSLQLGWLPSGGSGSLEHLILPAVTLSLPFIVVLTRLTRTEMSRALQSDYIQTAKAKGLPQNLVLWRHALRNVTIPLVTIIGLRLGTLLNGAVVVETLFRWPGVGNLMISSIGARDYPTIQFIVPITALLMIIVNFSTDAVYRFVDPRVRTKAAA